MTREPHKQRLQRGIPWLTWHGHPWAPWARIGPWTISVKNSQHSSMVWISIRDRRVAQPIVLLESADRPTRYRPCGHDESIVHAVIEEIKDLRMRVIMLARQLQMDASSLKVNPDPWSHPTTPPQTG